MRNGDTFRCIFFRKRGGATAPSIGSAFTGVISSLLAHSPDNNPANAELWGCDDAATPIIGRMAGASTFSAPTLVDNPSSGAGPKVRGASFNGKHYLAYQSAQDRLHCYDPNLSAPSVRRVSLSTPGQPTFTNFTPRAALSTADVVYRVRFRIKSSSVVVAESEPSLVDSAVQGVESGGSRTVVTKPTTVDSATHWCVEVADATVAPTVFYEISGSEQAVATTTWTNSKSNTAASTYVPLGTLLAVLGFHTAWTSVKYLLVAFNRLLGLGGYASGSKQSRVFYSAATGETDHGDDECVPNALTERNWIDLDEGTGGDGKGLAGPVNGVIYVFKYSQIRLLIPTGASSPVFNTLTVSTTKGAIDQECICVGEDAIGRPCVYFMDPQVGPMIVGAMPPTEIGQGVRDIWDVVNLSATNKVGQIVDYPKLGQVWFWIATGSSNDPTVKMVYMKATGAWEVEDTGGKTRLARCAVMFAKTLGASMSSDKVPYVGYVSSNNKLLRCDTSDLDDDSTACQAIVKTRPFSPNNGQPCRVTTPWVLAKVQDGVTLTVIVDLDFGRDPRTGTVSLTANAQELANGATRVWRRVEGIDAANGTFVQVQIGDAAAIAKSWTVERIYVPWEPDQVNP